MSGPKYHRLEEQDPLVGLIDDDEYDEFQSPRIAARTNYKPYRNKGHEDFEDLTINVADDEDEAFLRRKRGKQEDLPSCYRVLRLLFSAVIIVCLCILAVFITRILLPCSFPAINSTVSTSSTTLPDMYINDFVINVTGGMYLLLLVYLT